MTRLTLREAVGLLRAGQPVVIPTDTAYALAVDARQARAVQMVKRLKGRADTKPIALMAASLRQVSAFFVLTSREHELALRHWPGPLTLLLKPRAGKLAHRSLTLTRRIGVRVPRRALTRQLARRLGAPLTATSANRAHRPPCYTVRAVLRSLQRPVPALNIGPLPRRQVSTIAVVAGKTIMILRPGPIHPN